LMTPAQVARQMLDACYSSRSRGGARVFYDPEIT
jgi:hypothetical protein